MTFTPIVLQRRLISISFSGKFEFILMALTVTVTRAKYVQYMHPVIGDRYSLVIRNNLDAQFDPLMYINPLSLEVWILLFALSILPVFIMTFQEVIITDEKFSLSKFMKRFAQAFSSNFGGNFLSRGVQKSHQMTIFFYFINGIIIWIAFRATIIAGLSNREIKLPFEDLEGLAETDYFLTTTSRYGATGARFHHAKLGTIEEKVYKNNMDEEKSFIGNVKGLEELMSETHRAHFHYTQGNKTENQFSPRPRVKHFLFSKTF